MTRFSLERDEDGRQRAVGLGFTIEVLPDKAEVARIFWRNRVKPFVQPPIRQRILVAQVDDVRLYVDGDTLTLTKKDFA